MKLTYIWKERGDILKNIISFFDRLNVNVRDRKESG